MPRALLLQSLGRFSERLRVVERVHAEGLQAVAARAWGPALLGEPVPPRLYDSTQRGRSGQLIPLLADFDPVQTLARGQIQDIRIRSPAEADIGRQFRAS